MLGQALHVGFAAEFAEVCAKLPSSSSVPAVSEPAVDPPANSALPLTWSVLLGSSSLSTPEPLVINESPTYSRNELPLPTRSWPVTTSLPVM